MVSDELLIIERIGFIPAALIFMFYLFRETQRRAFAQADKVLTLAETTIKENTLALSKMADGLEQHMKQKDNIIAEMKDCRRDRDIKFDEIRRGE